MFGFKIISEERYLAERRAVRKLAETNDELVQENVRLKIDIKSLREQNGHMRMAEAKRREENAALVERNRKLKVVIKGHEAFRKNVKAAFQGIDFLRRRPAQCDHKCAECTHEQTDCIKYTDLSVCMLKTDHKAENKKFGCQTK